MDSRLNLTKLESHESDLARSARESRDATRWPDDGLAPRPVHRRRNRSLHPQAVLASLITWR